MDELINKRPILIVANSSLYLLHYRKILIKIIGKNNHVITISPIDKATKELSKISIHLPWSIKRKYDLSAISFVISFFKLLFLVRAIKPKLIHAHTLKTNLIVSIVSSLYGIPCILSFTGLGILSKSRQYNIIFKTILKTIIFFSIRHFKGGFSFKRNDQRSRFIFQNIKDKEYLESITKSKIK